MRKSKKPVVSRTKPVQIRKYLPKQVAIDVLNLYAHSGMSMGDFSYSYMDLHKYAESINKFNNKERELIPVLYKSEYDKIYNNQYYTGYSQIICGKRAPEEYAPTISYFVDKFLELDENGYEVSTTIFNMYLLEVRSRFLTFFTTQSNFDDQLKKYLGESSVRYEFVGNHMIVRGIRFSDFAVKKYGLDSKIPNFIRFEDIVDDVLHEYFDIGPQYSIKSRDMSNFIAEILRDRNLKRTNPSDDVYEIPWTGWIVKILNDRDEYVYNHIVRIMYGLRLKGTENALSMESMIEKAGKLKHSYFSLLYKYLSSDPSLESYRKEMEKYL